MKWTLILCAHVARFHVYSSWRVHHLRALYTALVWGNHLVPGVLAHHLPQWLVDHFMAATGIYQLPSWHHKKIIGRLIYNVGDRCQLVHNLVRDIYDGVPYPGEPHQLSMLTHITITMAIRYPVVIRLLETCGPDKHLILKWMLPVTIWSIAVTTKVILRVLMKKEMLRLQLVHDCTFYGGNEQLK